MYIFGIFVKSQVAISLQVNMWVLNSIQLIVESVLSQYYAVFSTITLQRNLKSGMVVPPKFFVVQECPGYPEFLCFHMKFKIFFSFCELHWDFNGDCVESVGCFWQDGYFYSINPTGP